MARTTVKIEGLKDLQEALKEFSKATAGNILKRAVMAGGAEVADEAVRRAPKRTGTLKTEIKVSKAKIINPGTSAYAQAIRETGDKAIAAAAARAANRAAGGSGRSAVCHVGPTKRAGQGILQEFGTAHHPPQPFMRPAWDSKGTVAAEAIRDTLAEGIEKATQRAARKAARDAAKIKSGR